MRPIDSSISKTNATIHISGYRMRLSTAACRQFENDIIHTGVRFKNVFTHIEDESA